MSRGKLFVFEGADKVGKTTLASMLHRSMQVAGVRCQLAAFPGNDDGTLGRHVYDLHHNAGRFGIKQINPTSLQVLHVAAHIDAISAEIVPALHNGETVILDRFWWSTWIYGTVFGASKPALKLMIEAEEKVWNGIHPTSVFLVTCPEPYEPEHAIEVWKNISRLYMRFAPQRRRKHPVEVIQNIKTVEQAFAQVRGTVSRYLKELK